jgi:glycosyltransferase involved in cell wall biosynthesis
VGLPSVPVMSGTDAPRLTSASPGPLRIVHLIGSGGYYGAERMVLLLASEQRRKGHDAIIVCSARSGDAEEFRQAAEAEEVPFRRVPDSPLALAAAGSEEAKRAGEAATILHAHGYKADISLGLRRPTLRHVVMVSTQHGLTHAPFPSRLWLYYRLAAAARLLMDARVRVGARLCKESPGPWGTAIVPNGLPASAPIVARAGLAPSGAADGWPERVASDRSRRVLALGRLAFEKGFDVLLEALPPVLQASDSLDVVIAGDGPERDALEARVSALGLGAHVRFVGFVPQVEALLEACDVFVMPSRSEGHPMALLQAMRRGKRIVATDVPGVVASLTSPSGDVAGWLCPRGSVEGLAGALGAAIGAAASERPEWAAALFRERYTAERMGAAYQDLYERAWLRRRPGRRGLPA